VGHTYDLLLHLLLPQDVGGLVGAHIVNLQHRSAMFR
jgi:hypothetical protein